MSAVVLIRREERELVAFEEDGKLVIAWVGGLGEARAGVALDPEEEEAVLRLLEERE